MALSFKFSILQAAPDPRRGERVNVGLVVFLKDKVDFRMPELRKLRALTGHGWDDIARAYGGQIEKGFADQRDPEALIKSVALLSETFVPSDLGELHLRSESEYEERIDSILASLIMKPTLSRGEKKARINSEISKMLQAQQVLAKRGQTIDDHVVVRSFVVSQEKSLVADFAYKNGSYRIVSTLDLRTSGAAHGKACERGATLHFARESLGSETKTLAVYAVDPLEIKTRSAEIDILKGFSGGNAFNWLNASEQQKFRHLLY